MNISINRRKRVCYVVSIFLMGLLAVSCGNSQAQGPLITSVNGVAKYPAGYNGRPKRATDPFLTPENSVLVLIDYQPHILAGVKTMAHKDLMHNTTALVRAAAHFNIPIIFSHVGVGLNGSQPFFKELTNYAPNAKIIDRTSVNAWEEPEFVAALKATGRKKIIMGGLWTDVCLAYPAIEATQAGYQVYVPEDVIGSITELSHKNGMNRMSQAGVVPLTWNVVLAELQRDHARKETGAGVHKLFLKYLFKVDKF